MPVGVQAGPDGPPGGGGGGTLVWDQPADELEAGGGGTAAGGTEAGGTEAAPTCVQPEPEAAAAGGGGGGGGALATGAHSLLAAGVVAETEGAVTEDQPADGVGSGGVAMGSEAANSMGLPQLPQNFACGAIAIPQLAQNAMRGTPSLERVPIGGLRCAEPVKAKSLRNKGEDERQNKKTGQQRQEEKPNTKGRTTVERTRNDEFYTGFATRGEAKLWGATGR